MCVTLITIVLLCMTPTDWLKGKGHAFFGMRVIYEKTPHTVYVAIEHSSNLNCES